MKSRNESILKKVFKNLIALFLGAVTGEILFIIYFLSIMVNKIAEKAGLGIIALAPIMFIIYSIVSIIIGGVLGVIIYNIYKNGKKKRK